MYCNALRVVKVMHVYETPTFVHKLICNANWRLREQPEKPPMTNVKLAVCATICPGSDCTLRSLCNYLLLRNSRMVLSFK
ncbi:hypothetical protein CA13_60180 [Planctomycetes bacterium CA13]|uniref:Uncharacterized protein n=1 Tax=Novipirellula herctigrandis TaxID=2527986 RepID=A0A5C5ZBM4_9BACT|nr:hypothetical protein CA13_60180 [Planctomycetes bacterium CA13]